MEENAYENVYGKCYERSKDAEECKRGCVAEEKGALSTVTNAPPTAAALIARLRAAGGPPSPSDAQAPRV